MKERKLIAPSIVKHFKKHPVTKQNKLYALIGIANSFKKTKDDFSSPYIDTNVAKPYMVAIHTENPELHVSIYQTPNGLLWQNAEFTEMAVYVALYSDEEKGVTAGTIYARPYEMFCSEVDKEKYPDEKQKFRFEEYNQEVETNKCCFCGEDLSYVESFNKTVKFECPYCLSRKLITRDDNDEIVSISHRKGPQAKILSIPPYMEKSKVAEKNKMIEEVISDKFKYTDNNILNPDFPINMIEYIKSIINKRNVILVNSKYETRKALHDAKLDYILAYPYNGDLESIVSLSIEKDYNISLDDITHESDNYKKYKEELYTKCKEVESIIKELKDDNWALSKMLFKYKCYGSNPSLSYFITDEIIGAGVVER